MMRGSFRHVIAEIDGQRVAEDGGAGLNTMSSAAAQARWFGTEHRSA